MLFTDQSNLKKDYGDINKTGLQCRNEVVLCLIGQHQALFNESHSCR